MAVASDQKGPNKVFGLDELKALMAPVRQKLQSLQDRILAVYQQSMNGRSGALEFALDYSTSTARLVVTYKAGDVVAEQLHKQYSDLPAVKFICDSTPDINWSNVSKPTPLTHTPISAVADQKLKSLITRRQIVQCKIAEIRKQKDLEFKLATSELQNELDASYAEEAKIMQRLSPPILPKPSVRADIEGPD